MKTICGETLVRELISAIDCCLCRDEVNPASRAQPKGLRTEQRRWQEVCSLVKASKLSSCRQCILGG